MADLTRRLRDICPQPRSQTTGCHATWWKGSETPVSKVGWIPAVWPLGRPFPSPSLGFFICKTGVGKGRGEPCLNLRGLSQHRTTPWVARATDLDCLTVLGPRCGQGRTPSEGARKASFRASPGFCRDSCTLVDATL